MKGSGAGEAKGARAWEGLLGIHKGLWIRLEDARRPPGLRPHAQPLPLRWPPATHRSSTASIFFFSHPLPQGTQAQYLFLTPLSSPSLLLAVPGCLGSLPPPRPPLRLERPAASMDTAASALRIRLFSFLSFLLTPPSSPSGSPASKRGQPRNQRRRLLQGQLETALKRLNFFPQIYTGIRHPQFALQAYPPFFSKSG